jgi:predicted dehydrogenase
MQQIARRNFLKSAGIATAVAPLAVTSVSWAGANDRIRVAVIGMGGRGRDHMHALAGITGVEVAVFCDPDESRLSKLAAEFESHTGKRPRLEPDVRRVLDDGNIDAITIAAPNHWHALATVWGCQAGKHVYVEKPVAHEMAAGRMMVEAARKYDRMVQGGTQRRSSPQVRKAIQALHDGIIGDIYMSRCIHFEERDSLGFKEPESPPPYFHWDLWLGPGPEQPFSRKLVPYNWHWFWDFGNGELGNNGVHCIDLARWGMHKGLPAGIHAVGGRYGYKDQGETPNTLVVTYEFQDGTQMVCDIRGRFSNPEADMLEGVFFYGSKGYLSIANAGPTVKLFLGSDRRPDPDFARIAETDPHVNMDHLHFQSFFDAIRAGKRELLVAEVNETYLSTAFCLLGNISYRLGRKLTLDPKRERFVGDAQADRLLAQEYRSPFALPAKV